MSVCDSNVSEHNIKTAKQARDSIYVNPKDVEVVVESSDCGSNVSEHNTKLEMQAKDSIYVIPEKK